MVFICEKYIVPILTSLPVRKWLYPTSAFYKALTFYSHHFFSGYKLPDVNKGRLNNDHVRRESLNLQLCSFYDKNRWWSKRARREKTHMLTTLCFSGNYPRIMLYCVITSTKLLNSWKIICTGCLISEPLRFQDPPKHSGGERGFKKKVSIQLGNNATWTH